MREAREKAEAKKRSLLPDKPPPGWQPTPALKDFEGKLRDRHLAQFGQPRKEEGGGGRAPVVLEDASDEM